MKQGKAIYRWNWLSLHAGRWSGRATGDENSSRSLREEKAQASSRGWAKGDYRSFADEQSRNAPICVLTNEARDPWERPGGTAFHHH
jgi:hypothetical protein